jgi:hypothetical protein
VSKKSEKNKGETIFCKERVRKSFGNHERGYQKAKKHRETEGNQGNNWKQSTIPNPASCGEEKAMSSTRLVWRIQA